MESSQLKEIQEAIQAVDKTLGYLKEAEEHLKSAANWGIVDILGGGLISTMAKRSKVNKAQGVIECAKDSVKQLKKELTDVNEFVHVDLEISDFVAFADYFFDGIISDWYVQSKIDNARNQVDKATTQLNQIRKRLVNLIG